MYRCGTRMQPSMMRRYFEAQIGVDYDTLPQWDIRKVMKDAGLHYRRLNTFQLVTGDAERYSVLILPDIVALGDEEWRAIEEFLSEGGTAIAFARTGLTDRNGKVRVEHRHASEVFGVRYRDDICTWQPDTFEVSLEDGVVHRPSVFRANPGVVVDKNVQVAGRNGAGEPLLIHKPHGGGDAYYLHCSDRFDLSPGISKFTLSLLAESGITRPFRLLLDEEDAGHFQCFRFLTDGPAGPEYVGLLHSLTTAIEENTRLTLRFELPGHLYDVLEGRYLGQGSAIQVTAPKRGRPRFYARLGYRVAKLHAQFPVRMATGTAEVATFQVVPEAEVEKPATHIFRIEVIDPAGEPVDPLSGNHVAKDGRLELLLDIPFNALSGGWTIQAQDVVSGVEATMQFQVE